MIIDKPSPTQIAGLRTLWKESFGDTDAFLDVFFTTAFSFDRCRCISCGGEVLAALYWFDCSQDNLKIAYVYAVATAKAYRNRGYGHTLMTDTHTHLKALGYDAVILVPGDAGLFNYYSGIGYHICSFIKEFSCSAGDSSSLSAASIHPLPKKSFQIKKVDVVEYAALRRKFLPENGILQEGANLEFLQTQASFYTGKDFLMACTINKNTLYAIEFLGDASAGPSILESLGCSHGVFRTTGGERAFSMYYTLSDNPLSLPAHFGFAFD